MSTVPKKFVPYSPLPMKARPIEGDGSGEESVMVLSGEEWVVTDHEKEKDQNVQPIVDANAI